MNYFNTDIYKEIGNRTSALEFLITLERVFIINRIIFFQSVLWRCVLYSSSEFIELR